MKLNRRNGSYLLLSILLVFASIGTIYSWGFFAHKQINRLAVFTLPDGMINFYKINIEYITENAVSPDKRRYAVKEEGPRHYIDMDYYGENPFDSMPRNWKDAVKKYSEDTLQAYGIVPWHIDKMVRWLEEAFREGNLNNILRYSADLGHYVADAHVPLHTTLNYNGHLTDQKGIHGFWETRLPELFSDEYDFFVGRAKYIKNPLETAWEIVEASFRAKDSVLLFEAALNGSFSPDKKYSHVQRGQSFIKNYSKEYSDEYHVMLNGMVEKRMRASVFMAGCFWYTAWVNAGKPDLNKLTDKEISAQLKAKLKEEEKMWRTGKIMSREHDD